MPDCPGEIVVVDVSVLVDLLAGTDYGPSAKARLAGTVMYAPAHLDAEALSALGRLQRAGALTRQLVVPPDRPATLPSIASRGANSRRLRNSPQERE